MWIAKDKTACDVPSFIEFPSGSSVCLFDYEGSFAIGFASGTQVEESNALYIQVMFRGTEPECRAYIADLVERLNAPAKPIGDYFEKGELRAIISQMGDALQDIARHIAGINT